MIALANKYSTYAKQVNCNRELVIVEGVSAALHIKEPLAVARVRKSIEAHKQIIEDNIKRYGKIKIFQK